MKLLTTQFKVHQANDFIDYLDQGTMYFYAGQTLAYPEGTPDSFENLIQETFYVPWNEMVFGKYVSSEDFNPMIRRRIWNSGTVYTKYDHEVALENTNFYVMTREGSNYSIFKCLDNNKGAPSTHEPVLSETSPTDEFYQTSDGYVWKLMYTFDQNNYNKYATLNYIPFIANNEVANSAVNGAIDVIDVVSSGSGYTNYVSGTISNINVSGNTKKFYIVADPGFTLSPVNGSYVDSALYITSGTGAGQLRKITDYGQEGNNKYIIIDSEFSPQLTTSSKFDISPNIILNGEGSGFQGRAIINTENDSIDRVEVINRGSDYNFATVTIGANTQSFNVDDYTQAELRAIIPPYGGHGSDQQIELFGKYVCIAETFAGTEVPSANNDYRTFGLVENVIFKEAILELDSVSGLSANDVVFQSTTTANGVIESIDTGNNTITMSNVYGVFDSSNVTVSNSEYTVANVIKNNSVFDQRLILNNSLTFGSGFEKDELVIQEVTGSQGYVHEYSNNDLYLVQTKGEFEISLTNEIVGQQSGTKALINNITQPDAIKYSGEIYYIENIEPVTRFDDQTESIKLIIGF